MEALAGTMSPVAAAPAVARPQWRPLLMYAMALALAVALLLPLLTVEIPPLLDYPNHLARMFVLAHGAQDPFFSRVYEQRWGIIPNIAIDAVVPPLLSFIPLYTAGKLVLALTLLLPVAGTVAYSRATLRVGSLWPLASGLVAYNSLFLLGFMNFLISVGLAMLAAALWLRLRRGHPVLAVVVLAPVAVFLFFMHIFGLALFGLLSGAEELVQLLDRRRRNEPIAHPALAAIASIAGVFAAPAILYAMSNFEQAPGDIGWGMLHWKLVRLFGSFLQDHAAAGLYRPDRARHDARDDLHQPCIYLAPGDARARGPAGTLRGPSV